MESAYLKKNEKMRQAGVRRLRVALLIETSNAYCQATLEMSAVRTLSLLAAEVFPPRMILGWTIRFLLPRVGLVVGRIGLRSSATRAPADRLYTTRPGLRRRGLAFVLLPGVGRKSVKLRGSGGRAPSTASRRHFAVTQILIAKADGHTPIQTLLDHHPATPLTGMHRGQQLVKTILETHGIVVGHHPLLLNAQDRRQVVAWPQRPMGIRRLTLLPTRQTSAG